MGGENKFFFEEDSEEVSGAALNPEDEANIFGAIVSETGVSSQIESMEPITIMPDGKVEMKSQNTQIVLIEYGIVQDNYAIHITPTHDKRNLSSDKKLNQAIESTILEMNKKVPLDLKVAIHLPQADWEVKALSFVVQGGANAWNFDIQEFEKESIPEILKKVTSICMVL
jgi:autotransporter translocation and assembly factor TamB